MYFPSRIGSAALSRGLEDGVLRGREGPALLLVREHGLVHDPVREDGHRERPLDSVVRRLVRTIREEPGPCRWAQEPVRWSTAGSLGTLVDTSQTASSHFSRTDLRTRTWIGVDLHTSWGGGQFRHPDFPKSLGNRENP